MGENGKSSGNGNAAPSESFVSEVKIREEEKDILVRYSDGHVAAFQFELPNGDKNNPILRRVTLSLDGEAVFTYNAFSSIHSAPLEGRISSMDGRCTQQRFAKYWETTRGHLYYSYYLPLARQGKKPDKLHWQAIYDGGGERDLEKLINGGKCWADRHGFLSSRKDWTSRIPILPQRL